MSEMLDLLALTEAGKQGAEHDSCNTHRQNPKGFRVLGFREAHPRTPSSTNPKP